MSVRAAGLTFATGGGLLIAGADLPFGARMVASRQTKEK